MDIHVVVEVIMAIIMEGKRRYFAKNGTLEIF